MLIHLLFRTADFYFQGQFICVYIIFHLCLACKMYSFSANQNDINRHNTSKLRFFTSKVYVEENLFMTELLCVPSVLSPSFVRMTCDLLL